MIQHREQTVRISQAKREDIWKESAGKADIPGPGALDPVDHTWEEGGFKFSRDERFPRMKDDGPGPGTYELLDD